MLLIISPTCVLLSHAGGIIHVMHHILEPVQGRAGQCRIAEHATAYRLWSRDPYHHNHSAEHEGKLKGAKRTFWAGCW